MNPNANSFQWNTSYSGPGAGNYDSNYGINNAYNEEEYYGDGYDNTQEYYGDDYNDDVYEGGDNNLTLEGNYYDGGFIMDPNTAVVVGETEDHVVPPSPGTFYLLSEPYFPHIQSAPISAVAIDPAIDAIYAAGHTIILNKKRRHATYSTPGTNSSGGPSTSMNRGISSTVGSSDQRVSMLATHSFPDGMLYSAVAGHEEARKEVLDEIINTLYGSDSGRGSNAKSSASSGNQLKIPKHAYRPPYARPLDQAQQAAMIVNTFQPRNSNMGISTILPFHSPATIGSLNEPTTTAANEGYVCTVSPSSVRVHSRGGLLLSENKIEGLLAATFHPGVYHEGSTDMSISANATHVTVGGISCRSHDHAPLKKSPNLYCLDLYSSSLKEVSSHTVGVSGCSITDLTTSHETCNVVAGCSDGTLRILDGSWRGGNYMECAQVKAHGGGIAHVAVSGNLICTTGYSSRSGYNNSSNLYAFPDEHVLVFDIRYLGRGGIAHPFSGLNGGPRFISFLPHGQDESGDNRILVGSGQLDGGLQIITPFQGLINAESDLSNYVKPPLNPDGESISAMQMVGKDLAIGTSLGNILQYRMAGYSKSIVAPKKGNSNNAIYSPRNKVTSEEGQNYVDVGTEDASIQKEQLELPSYELEPPPLSIDPLALAADTHLNELTNHSIFNAYILHREPVLSSLVDETGQPNPYSFGTLTDSVIKQTSKRILSKPLLDLISAEDKNKKDFLITIPTSKLNLDLVVNEGTELPNPNKLLHEETVANTCYDIYADPRKKEKRDRHGRKIDSDEQLPRRYAGKNRQQMSRFSSFEVASQNDTLYPGWDYSGPNSYTCSVLLLLYFVPEIRYAMLNSQLRNFESIIAGKKGAKANDGLLCAELGFLFHQINCLAFHGMVYPKPLGAREDPCRNIIGAFIPSNFLSTFMTMPEADALALLDGNPAATEVERRPEAFYRFLLHHLDIELCSIHTNKRQSSKSNMNNMSSGLSFIDSLYGMNAISMNQFVNEGAGSESISVTRSNTVDLAYDTFISKTEETAILPDFGTLLQFSLCKDIPLRAWCNTTSSYETVIQRKIVTSLPVIMSLSCSCAGVNGEDRLPFWRKVENDYNSWLPEFIEVEIEDDGNVVTRQLRGNSWEEFKGDGLPKSITEKVKNASANIEQGRRHVKYELQSIVTFINQDVGAESRDCRGHHVLHHRVPKSHKKEILLNQLEIAERHLNSMLNDDSREDLTLIRNVTPEDLKKRIDHIQGNLEALDMDQNTHEWVLFNGPSVSSTTVEDALAFHVSFKEPCIITYRQVDENPKILIAPKVEIPPSILTSSKQSVIQDFSNLIAFDAEFVQVQHEDSILTATGNKMIIREGRNALGRMSLIDCRTGKTVIDDHVLPREPIVDYLTRFSGIKPSDLDPKISPYHLISSRHAYLKMRYLVDRGCIFVGHGLSQDFLTVNLFVPPSQIVDTTDIFHLERRRLISLRFLVNILLGRDMQQDVHDSIEDSMAACELYVQALKLKEKGLFDKVLHEIYEVGQKIDWKVGELKKSGGVQLDRYE